MYHFEISMIYTYTHKSTFTHTHTLHIHTHTYIYIYIYLYIYELKYFVKAQEYLKSISALSMVAKINKSVTFNLTSCRPL